MRRLEIERKLQIDQRQVLAAAAADRGAQPVERLGGAGLRRIDQERQLVAVVDRLHFLDDQRMVRQHLVEIAIDLQRIGLVATARQIAAVSFDHAHRGGIEFVSALVALAGFLLVVGKIEDEAGMHILEDRIPVRARQLVHRIDRGARIA